MNGIDPQTGTALCSRRRLISGAAALIAVPVFVRGAFGQESRRPTPAQTEGPFYPVNLPQDSDADLLANGKLRYAQGQPAWLEGTLTDLAGKPVHGASVEIWQSDQQGHYHHPVDGRRADPAFQGFGRADAAFRAGGRRPAGTLRQRRSDLSRKRRAGAGCRFGSGPPRVREAAWPARRTSSVRSGSATQA